MSYFIDKIFSLPTPLSMVVLICLIFAVSGVLSTLAVQLRKFFSHREEIEFKRELLDRGMGVEEIERLVNARTKS